MIKTILAAAGVPGKPGRFPDPPKVHAVYFESIDSDGADDGTPVEVLHDCTIELYATTLAAGDKARDKLLAQVTAAGFHPSTQGWYWLSATQSYQEIIEFSYTSKSF